MKTTHTPGPWTINAVYRTLVDAPSGICGGSRLICSTEVGNKNGDAYDYQIEMQNNANARLIAAAPELLEALQYAEQCLTMTECTGEKPLGNGHALDRVRAAIAKATGSA